MSTATIQTNSKLDLVLERADLQLLSNAVWPEATTLRT